MPTGIEPRCPKCGAWVSCNPLIPHFCARPPEYGHHEFTPAPLTADEIRKIMREELQRAGVGKSDVR